MRVADFFECRQMSAVSHSLFHFFGKIFCRGVALALLLVKVGIFVVIIDFFLIFLDFFFFFFFIFLKKKS
jgi:hypothetical protein